MNQMEEDIKYSGCVFHFNTIYEYDDSMSKSKYVLLSHPLYYQQNENISEQDDIVDARSASKALLILHSLPFNYGYKDSFFNNADSDNTGYEMIPYGFLVFLGGLLYREMYYEKKGVDIIKKYDENCYKYPDKGETMLVKDGNIYRFSLLRKNDKRGYVKINEVFNDKADIYIRNKLIMLFEDFVNETSFEFNSIELKYVDEDSNRTNGKSLTVNYFDGEKFKNFINSLNDKSIIVVNEILNGKEIFTCSGNNFYVSGFSGNYSIGLIENASLKLFYKEDDYQLQSIMDKLYNHKTGVVTLRCQKGAVKNRLKYTDYEKVVNGFDSTMKVLLDGYDKDRSVNRSNDIYKSKNTSDEDLKKSIYLYMKQFWDKWLCGEYNRYDSIKKEYSSYVKPFTVEWFSKQFLFIDSFYNDISTSLKLDCSVLNGIYKGYASSDNPSGPNVYSHIANVAEKHRCNFFCYPDFIDFNKKDSNGNSIGGEKILGDLFRPVPYNDMNPIQVENQFVIIRTVEAQYNGDCTQYKNDGFDIWKHGVGTDIAPETFQSINLTYDSTDNRLRMAYRVPAFGVAFSRQNNSIFKSIEVGMDTIQITEQSVKAISDISKAGNSNRRDVTFYGSDIYSVYSSYSYIVTVTMMGDAQIQPLMYFQLMNIPMFNGTYMVIEVKHSIIPGDFTTVFRGIKLSKIMLPDATSWFTISPETSEPSNNSEVKIC